MLTKKSPMMTLMRLPLNTAEHGSSHDGHADEGHAERETMLLTTRPRCRHMTRNSRN